MLDNLWHMRMSECYDFSYLEEDLAMEIKSFDGVHCSLFCWVLICRPINRLGSLSCLQFFNFYTGVNGIKLYTSVVSPFIYLCTILFYFSPGISDIVLYLCEKEHVEGGMIFQLLEDLTEMSTMRNCKDIFGYIESKQDILGKVIFILFLVFVFLFYDWLH